MKSENKKKKKVKQIKRKSSTKFKNKKKLLQGSSFKTFFKGQVLRPACDFQHALQYQHSTFLASAEGTILPPLPPILKGCFIIKQFISKSYQVLWQRFL